MKTTSEMIAVMLGFERGERIEISSRLSGGDWRLNNHPTWDWNDFDYRIAEKKPVMVEKWLWIISEGVILWITSKFYTEKEIQDAYGTRVFTKAEWSKIEVPE